MESEGYIPCGIFSSYLKCRRVKEDVSGLSHIGTVHAVMIWNI